MNLDAALDVMAVQGRCLRERLCLPWEEQAQQAVCALRFRRQVVESGHPVQLAAIVGGASSGKSTVFNNLLGGRRVSLVTIRSHATCGLIIAAHERLSDRLDRWLNHHRTLLPTLEAQPGRLDADLQGQPRVATVVHHDLRGFEDTLLIDTADFTSNTAEREGDVTLSLLPWFDRLVVIVDHERWFDRQVVDHLSAMAERFAQPRIAVFNRTAEHPLAESDRARLEEQARHLGAERVCVLNYHRGRGFRRFEHETLQEVVRFLAEPPPPREQALQAEVQAQAAAVLAANRARLERLDQLERVLAVAARRYAPFSRWECITALMTSEERERTGLISRVLGISQLREWLGRQRRWLEEAVPRLPWAWKRAVTVEPEAFPADNAEVSREQRGREWLTAQCERQVRRLNEEMAASELWEDLRVACGHPLALPEGGLIESFRPRAEEVVTRLAGVLDDWDAKVRHECEGVSPKLVGTLGMTVLAGAAVLVAVPGPIGALTPLIAAGALKAGLLKLGAAGVFGAVSGRPLARLAETIREKLLASPEFNHVREAAENMRLVIEEHGRAAADRLSQQARGFTLSETDPLRQALEILGKREAQSR